MTAARKDLRDLPDWPRLLSREQAAAYLGISLPMFDSHVGDAFPEPLRFGRRRLFDRRALDKAVDDLSAPQLKSSLADEIRQGLLNAGREVETY